MKGTPSITAAVILLLVLSFAACSRKSGNGAPTKHTLHGKVVEVDEKAKTLTVDHEKIEGYMGAMTMPYTVDDAEVLKRAKRGDRVTGTVYTGDFKLYEVQLVPGTESNQ